MNTTDNPSNPLPTSNGLTRRSFMKKSALTVGAVAILGQGIGLAIEDGGSGNGSYRMKCNYPSAEDMTQYTTKVIRIPQGTTPETYVDATIDMDAFTTKGKDPDGESEGYLVCAYSSGVAINIYASTNNHANWTSDNLIMYSPDTGSITAAIDSNWKGNEFPDIRTVNVTAGNQDVYFSFTRILTDAPAITSGVQLSAIWANQTGDEENSKTLIINQGVHCNILNIFNSFVRQPSIPDW